MKASQPRTRPKASHSSTVDVMAGHGDGLMHMHAAYITYLYAIERSLHRDNKPIRIM